MIKDVVTHKLRLIPDELGRLMEIIRKDEPHYKPIRQIVEMVITFFIYNGKCLS
jgi:hypothetical protein